MSKERKINVKVDTSNLPKKGNFIDWKKSIGYKVKFIYENLSGEIEIVDRLDNGYLLLKYKDRTIEMSTGNLTKGYLGKLLGLVTNEFKYNIGDNIKDDKRDFTIIDREYREVKESKRIYNYKFYKYHCHKCNGEHWTVESGINAGNNCIFCSNQKELLGFNTIYDRAKWMCDLGVSEEDAKKYMPNSNDDIYVTCPYCKTVKKTKPAYIYCNHSIGCNCGDGISYPEKFTFKFLEQLNIDFIWQYTKANAKWCEKYKYDFYFELNGKIYIIEVHGCQHYDSNNEFERTLEEEQINDKLKYELAIKNGINPDNYIVIDFRESTLEWGKEHILTSKLNELFDLSIIDWNKCEEYALKNIVKEVCDYWKNNKPNNKYLTTGDVAKEFKINSTTTINKYLKQGTKLEWCEYNPKEEKYLAHVKASKIASSKKLLTVLMYDKNMNFIGEYESTTWLSEHSVELFGFKLDRGCMVNVCNGKKPHYKGYIFKYKKDLENIS